MARGKHVLILVDDDFEDIELTEPLRDLKEEGAHVMLAGCGKSLTYKGKRRIATVRTDIMVKQVAVEDYDAIIIPGGYVPDRMRLHESILELVRKANNMGKVIAAICHGPQVLISAGIVKGRRLTSWPSIAVDLQNAGATWVDAPVVVDRNLITSRKPADLPRFNQALIEALSAVPASVMSGEQVTL